MLLIAVCRCRWCRASIQPLNALAFSFEDRYNLTYTEYKIADLVAQGYGIKEISLMLNKRTNTLKIHLVSIFNKVGCDSRFYLALIAYQRAQQIIEVQKIAAMYEGV